MNIEAGAHALTGMAAGLLIGILWLGPIRSTLIDWARDSMFAARDGLFDAAKAGAIGFNDPRYRAIREALNNNIRYAHTVSSARLAWHSVWLRRTTVIVDVGGPYAIARSIDDIVTRQAVQEALHRSDRAMAKLIFFKTPVLTALLFVIAALPDFRLKWPSLDDFVEALRPYSYLVQIEGSAGG